ALPDARTALPPDDDLRAALHNEVHARPTARIRLPALVVYVAVLNDGVSQNLLSLPDGSQHRIGSGQAPAAALRLHNWNGLEVGGPTVLQESDKMQT
ncbi:MAG: hypothetical protein RL268_1684, partial [Pseudomonadota bacterium]